MLFQTLGNKPNKVFITVKNNEVSATIAANNAEPVAFNTLDGISVVKLSTVGAKGATGGLCGIVAKPTPPGKYSLAQVYGICTSNVPIMTQTKASTDATFASLSLDAGVILTPDTTLNGFGTAASVGASGFLPWGVIPATVGFASSSGVTGAGNSLRTLYANVFLRLM